MYSSVVEDEPRIGAYPGRLIEQSNEIVDIVVSILEVQQALDNFKRDLSIVGRKRRRRRARYRHSTEHGVEAAVRSPLANLIGSAFIHTLGAAAPWLISAVGACREEMMGSESPQAPNASSHSKRATLQRRTLGSACQWSRRSWRRTEGR
jgi:hypothetical protein